MNKIEPFQVVGKGSSKGSLSKGVLTLDTPLMVLGNKNEVISYNDTMIQGIKNIAVVEEHDVHYNYAIQVNGSCPQGFSKLTLTFKDSTDTTYNLTITDPKSKTHTVSFNSDTPEIKEIKWKFHG